jgi:hypothetical protein
LSNGVKVLLLTVAGLGCNSKVIFFSAPTTCPASSYFIVEPLILDFKVEVAILFPFSSTNSAADIVVFASAFGAVCQKE